LNYLVGDESKWKTNHPTYERIVYKDARPGVDLAAESRAHGVKYSLHASPGAVGRSIALRYEGAREIRLLEGGAAIEVVTGTGTLREEGLVAYQEGPGGRLPVEAHYRVVGADTCAIEFGDFDPALPLVVDPTIGWSSYLGGVGTEQGFRGCPKCGQEKARRLLSTGSGLIFKGAGFYTTDYKRTSANSEPKSTAPANSGKVSQPATSNP
jgi:predicted nucleic acid-binding Zn ribbon protein